MFIISPRPSKLSASPPSIDRKDTMRTKHVMRMVRTGAQWLHRWLGLALGIPLVLAGLSGTVLVFAEQIDAALNPRLFHSLAPCVAPLDLDGAVASLRRHWPQAQVSRVELPAHAGGSYRLLFRAPGMVAGEAMLDACDGAVLGSRDRAVVGIDGLHLMPTLQAWHLNLLLGQPGRAALGYLGLVWLVLLAAGLLLAWPRHRQWRRALSINLRQHTYRSHVDLHRAIGIVSAALLITTSFTGVYNGLPEQTRGALALLTDVAADHRAIGQGRHRDGDPAIGWSEARAIAGQYLGDGAGEGAALLAIQRQPQRGVYLARLRRADDVQRSGTLRLFISMRDGSVLATVDPLAGSGGDRFLASLYPWHSGQLGGMAGRGLIVLAGLLPALFFITGISTWVLRRNKKRAPR